MKREKAINKIKKLLRLAGNNPNENERLAALSAAYDMLAQHNLEMRDVHQTPDEDDRLSKPNAQLSPWRVYSVWERVLFCSVGTLMYVTVSYVRNPQKPKQSGLHALLVGTEDNRDAAILLYQWLVRSIKRESRLLVCSRKDFCVGATVAIQQQVQSILDQEAWEAAQARNQIMWGYQLNGLIPVSKQTLRAELVKQNDEIIERLLDSGRLNKSGKDLTRKVTVDDQRAFIRGYQYGQTLPVNRMTPKGRRVEAT